MISVDAGFLWPSGPENQAVLDADLQRAKDRLKDDSVAADKASRTLPEQSRQIVEDAKSRATVAGYGAMTDREKVRVRPSWWRRQQSRVHLPVS